MIPYGTIANAGTVIAGSLIGHFLGRRFPENVREIVFQGLGLATLVVGVQMALKMQRPLILIFSIILGGVIGELLKLETHLNGLGDRLKGRLKSEDSRFTDGFVTASLIFCVGSMAIVGAFEEGLRGDATILLTKAIMDGFVSIALASTFGLGVLFSFLPVFLYQFGLTLFALWFKDLFSAAMINELTAVGGLLIIGIGLNILNIKKIKLGNLLPSLALLTVMVAVFG